MKALWAVRTFGGVLEHPSNSRAWQFFNLFKPGGKGWSGAGDAIGWTCEVEQGNYGHRARKKTWLYAVGCELPSMRWGKSKATMTIENMGHAERAATPIPFRDVLIDIARGCSAKETI
jgi:hypothetical protein